MKTTIKLLISTIIVIFVISISVVSVRQTTNSINNTITTSSTTLSNKKIGWGIKRSDNHIQPDLGSKNRELIDKYKGIAIGNNEKKYVYLTFDEGYEAGYTPDILKVLKENQVNATFFLTAHFVNTQEDLVKEMINNGHIIGNHTPKYLMSISYKKIKC